MLADSELILNCFQVAPASCRWWVVALAQTHNIVMVSGNLESPHRLLRVAAKARGLVLASRCGAVSTATYRA